MTYHKAIEKMAAYQVTSLPIMDDGKACGVISATDILYARTDVATLHEDVLTYVQNSRNDASISRSANCIVSCCKVLTIS